MTFFSLYRDLQETEAFVIIQLGILYKERWGSKREGKEKRGSFEKKSVTACGGVLSNYKCAYSRRGIMCTRRIDSWPAGLYFLKS